jgi:hypothetical protein
VQIVGEPALILNQPILSFLYGPCKFATSLCSLVDLTHDLVAPPSLVVRELQHNEMITSNKVTSHEYGPENEVVERYSIFTPTQKWAIVALASFAAWFSTLSSFIYFPAIPSLSKSLGVSIEKINLTVTTYMAIATIAPTIVADAAEILGRRPTYAITLGIYFVANLAIALSKTYEALLALRVLQALAISGMRLF